jgi:hypothetical protein
MDRIDSGKSPPPKLIFIDLNSTVIYSLIYQIFGIYRFITFKIDYNFKAKIKCNKKLCIYNAIIILFFKVV